MLRNQHPQINEVNEMLRLTTAELKQWKSDLFALCESLKNKNDGMSNAMRITACAQIEQIMYELIRRNEL